ncbi:MAG: DedA family protein [Planctomycetes bacterium]|nr:DedA family protein [Planctomycetota bacterium]
MKNPLKRLYDWVLSWAGSPFGGWALFGIAFAESSFFPIPPDVLLIALGLSVPTKSFRYALICSLGSVLGGSFGYLIGLVFYDSIGHYIINFYGIQEGFERVRLLYQQNAFLAVAIAGFTPIPYKVFTIAAGFCRIDFLVFVIASVVSRSARFFIVAVIIYFWGARAKRFIDRYFNILTIIFAALLILGFVMIKWLG